ncbi:hypothetical protein DW846_02400 [Ruminococcus sp. AM36-2AA]|nr:hypothetical protein DW851_02395 [Ruminococcus sp. AM36-5]RGH62467.1 hypothetical protein DW846_02400 [Ruminococcus sp. AM36-2AA]
MGFIWSRRNKFFFRFFNFSRFFFFNRFSLSLCRFFFRSCRRGLLIRFFRFRFFRYFRLFF